MVADALRHAPASLDYLSRLRQPDIFRFCAIPQASMNADQSIITVFFIWLFSIVFIVAIATLERVYNNPDVLEGVVKIRKVNNNNNFRKKKTIPNFTKNFIRC